MAFEYDEIYNFNNVSHVKYTFFVVALESQFFRYLFLLLIMDRNDSMIEKDCGRIRLWIWPAKLSLYGPRGELERMSMYQ